MTRYYLHASDREGPPPALTDEQRMALRQEIADELGVPAPTVLVVPAAQGWDLNWQREASILATRKGFIICGARGKRAGTPCAVAPVPGRDRCRMHGGPSPRGDLAARFEGKGFTRDLPTRLAERIEELLDDPDLTSLGRELSVLDARLGELFELLQEQSVPERWKLLERGIRRVRDMLRTEEDADVLLDNAAVALDDLLDRVREVYAERKTWDEIYGVMEHRRKLAETERKREDQLAQTMTARQAATFLAGVKIAIREEVKDPLPDAITLQRNLALRLDKLLFQSAGRG